MNHRTLSGLTLAVIVLAGCSDEGAEDTPRAASGPAANLAGDGVALTYEGESRLQNVRQLTAGGENAEAYWAFDGSQLIYQAKKPGAECDQIFLLDPHTAETHMVSTGEGRTTCSYFYPSGDEILYSSTHHHDASCPPNPDMSMGYVWPIYKTYDVFVANADGTNPRQLTTEDGYDAEATFSPQGDRIIFTSDRNGDLDLYSMNPDGSDVVQLTDRLGYDGGAFYSPDGSKIIWRAHYPEEGSAEAEDYVRLLEQGLLRPGELEVYVMDADGSNVRQVTDVGGANFAPYWHPDGDKILWSSNHHDPAGRDFEIYMINLDGTGLEQITHSEGFDGFPVFSPDGKHLVFGSNRNNGGTSDTNVFIAEWGH
ncbi:MAG: TolB family protein [Longimicrobiales bacterium]